MVELVNNELKNMQKGAVKAHFVILFQHMNEAKEGNP
jgi:hypothetical protein